jgi:hypothetical protein
LIAIGVWRIPVNWIAPPDRRGEVTAACTAAWHVVSQPGR